MTLISELKPADSTSPITNTADSSSGGYGMTSLSSMNNGLMIPHPSLASYAVQSQRSDSIVKVESAENLTAHAHYGSSSPTKHHPGLENEHLHHHAHSISSMNLTSGDSNTLGQVSVGAS